MTITRDGKKKIFGEHGRHAKDTGSPEVQVAILSERIAALTEHMKTHKNDIHSRRGLLMLVGKRRKILKYLEGKNKKSYQALLEKLGLRGGEKKEVAAEGAAPAAAKPAAKKAPAKKK